MLVDLLQTINSADQQRSSDHVYSSTRQT